MACVKDSAQFERALSELVEEFGEGISMRRMTSWWSCEVWEFREPLHHGVGDTLAAAVMNCWEEWRKRK